MAVKKKSKVDILMESIRPQSFSFLCPIYDHRIDVVLGEGELIRVGKAYPSNTHLQYVVNECIGEMEVGGYSYTFPSCVQSIIYLDLRSNYFELMRSLAHEIRHTVDSMLIPRGFHQIPGDENEAFAYLQGYLTEVILEKIKYS